MVRALVVAAAVAQLVVAIALAVDQDPSPSPERRVTAVVPADAVDDVATTTSTTLPPVVVEVPVATAPPPPTTAVPAGAVSGVIGAGAGGTGRADLRDEAGNTWHSEASSQGAYRFDGLAAGRYQLVLSAESAPVPCTPDGTCIGTALSMSKRVIDIEPGRELREDYSPYGPTGPAPSTTTTTATPQSSTTTTTTAAN